MAILTEIEDVKRVLKTNQNIAVLGAHPQESKAAHYVPRYLQREGYEIYPVNPNYTSETLFGKPVLASLKELNTPIDIVEIFRRSEAIPEHLEAILAMNPRPKVVWLQLGIQNDNVAKELSDAGIDVIQDRCMLADHQRLL